MNRKHKAIVALVFLLLFALSCGLATYSYKRDRESELANTKLNAQIYADRIHQDFLKAIAVTETLDEIIVNNRGIIHYFDRTAAGLMTSEISSIQLAADGNVTNIYPFERNEEGMINLFEDEERGPIVTFSKEHDIVTMQGPFELKQGGQAIAIRNPVFLYSRTRKTTFWGFTIVIVKVPEIYEHTLTELESFGYDYQLETTVSPLTQETKVVSTSLDEGQELTAAQTATFNAGECKWTVSVQPKKIIGASHSNIVGLGLLLLSLLLTIMTFMLLKLLEQKEKLNDMAMRDELTGLYSRRGYMAKLDKVLNDKKHSLMTAVFVDLDDFKAINDVHGHIIGDEALKHVAQELNKAFPENAVVGRTGGDEFSVLIMDQTPEECRSLIHDLVSKVHAFWIGEGYYTYTLSMGYAHYPTQASDRTNLLILADEALYAAKLDGKNNAKQYEQAMSDIKRTQLGFSIKSFSAGLPGGIMVYKADKSEQILYGNEELFQMTGCKDFNDFLAFTGGSFKGFVHEDDFARVSRDINHQIQEQKTKNDGVQKNADNSDRKIGDFVEYRIRNKDGEVLEMVDLGRLVHDENYGDIFFVFVRERASLPEVF